MALNILCYSGIFIPVSSLKVFGHSIHSERRRICLGKPIQALQNDTIIISWVFSFRVIQPTVRWHTFKTFMFVFLFIIKTFRDMRLLKYLTNKELMTFINKRQAKTFTWPDMIAYIDAPNKGIEQACSWASCDIHISPFSINPYFNL